MLLGSPKGDRRSHDAGAPGARARPRAETAFEAARGHSAASVTGCFVLIPFFCFTHGNSDKMMIIVSAILSFSIAKEPKQF